MELCTKELPPVAAGCKRPAADIYLSGPSDVLGKYNNIVVFDI